MITKGKELFQSKFLPGPEYTAFQAEEEAARIRATGGLAWASTEESRGAFYGYRVTFIPFAALAAHVAPFNTAHASQKERFLTEMALSLGGSDEE